MFQSSSSSSSVFKLTQSCLCLIGCVFGTSPSFWELSWVLIKDAVSLISSRLISSDLILKPVATPFLILAYYGNRKSLNEHLFLTFGAISPLRSIVTICGASEMKILSRGCSPIIMCSACSGLTQKSSSSPENALKEIPVDPWHSWSVFTGSVEGKS